MTSTTGKEGFIKSALIDQAQKLMESRGRRAVEAARELMLGKRKLVRSRNVRKALHYFVTRYWTDLARPTLMSLVCEAVGKDRRRASQMAVPIMILTAGMDIHDDIIDRSVEKNGRLTVYGKFGEEISLLLGDSLILEGLLRFSELLQKLPQRRAERILETVELTFFELGDAEALELDLRGKLNTSPRDYLRIVERKAADVEAYTHICALLAGASADKTRALCTFGRIFGMLAILRDDIVDFLDEGETLLRIEKEVPPLPVLFATKDRLVRQSIMTIMEREDKTVKDAKELIDIVIESNGMISAREEIERLRQKGLLSLSKLKYGTDELTLLLDVLTNV